jgi:hypothetical protein
MVATAANPKAKAAKKGDPSADFPMGNESTGGLKRPPRADSDADRDSISDGFPSVAGVAPAPAAAVSSASNPAASLEAIFAKFDTRLTEMQDASGQKLDQLSDCITNGLLSVTNKIDSHVLATVAKIANLQGQITAITAGLATPRSFADAAGSAASSGHPPAAHAAPAPRVAATGPDEACLVFIRGFPVIQPGIVLREYAEEALEILPTLERALVKLRVSPADSQFSLVFQTPALAKTFVEDYTARKFAFEDCDKVLHPLACRTGKPLALRRRGGLIMPIYALLQTILSRTRGYTTAAISQVSKLRGGAMHTDFYALIGKTLTPLFTLRFGGVPEQMAIEAFYPSTEHCPLSNDDLAILAEAAVPK